MAMNPGKLKALVDTQSMDPGLAALQNPQVDLGADGDDDLDDDEDEQAAEPGKDPLTRGNELIEGWGELGEALKDSAGEIIDGAHEVGGDLLLAKPPEEALDEVHDAFDKMPDEIQHCLAMNCVGLTDDDVQAVAAALIDGHDGDTEEADQKLVSTYLTQLCAIAKDEVDPDDLEQYEEEDEDEEGDEKEDDAEDEVEPPAAEDTPPVDQ